MTDNFPPTTPNTGETGGSPQGKADAAREQASDVKDHAVDAGGQVLETSKQRAGDVVDEAKSQAKDLLGQTRDELRDQAAQQQRRVAEGLRSVSDEFAQMARNSENGGMAAELVHNAAKRTGSVAGWLDQRDPGSLLDEVKRYARRNPGTFIAIAAAAGLVAGRLTRSIASNASDDNGTTGAGRATGSSAAGVPSASGHEDALGGDYESAYGADTDRIPAAPDTTRSAASSTPLYSSLAGETKNEADPFAGEAFEEDR